MSGTRAPHYAGPSPRSADPETIAKRRLTAGEGFERVPVRCSFATPRVAAGALFFDGAGRVLLVHPTYKNTWDIPGGYVERGESPAAACRREVLEELGLDRPPLRLISVDWAPHEREGDKLLFLFDCGDLADDEQRVRLDGSELDRWEWVNVDQLDHYVVSRIARRIRSVADGAISANYLEYGQVPANLTDVTSYPER